MHFWLSTGRSQQKLTAKTQRRQGHLDHLRSLAPLRLGGEISWEDIDVAEQDIE